MNHRPCSIVSFFNLIMMFFSGSKKFGAIYGRTVWERYLTLTAGWFLEVIIKFDASDQEELNRDKLAIIRRRIDMADRGKGQVIKLKCHQQF